MRIVLDLQACQGESRFRGIGRYSLSLAIEMVKEILNNKYEVFILLNKNYKDSITEIRKTFEHLILDEYFIEFGVEVDTAYQLPDTKENYAVSVADLKKKVEALNPDIYYISEPFGGFLDNVVVSLDGFDKRILVVATIYDLIPYVYRDPYLLNEQYKKFYLDRFERLNNTNMLLAISEHSKIEAIKYLNIKDNQVVNISAAVDDRFQVVDVSQNEKNVLLSKFNITKEFVLYVPGGFDPRKNFDRLVQAYSQIPKDVRVQHQLVIGSKIMPDMREHLTNLQKSLKLDEDEIVLTSYLDDKELIQMYNLCKVYVFPSICEGFGLPVLEAMSCGAPVIGSNVTSLPEVIGNPDALFDPYNVSSIKELLQKTLSDDKFRDYIQKETLKNAHNFCWNKSAQLAIDFFEKKHQKRNYIYVDVSEVIHSKAHTGVQRVVKSYLQELIENPPKDYIIEPVYSKVNEGKYYYAKSYRNDFLGLETFEEEKTEIDLNQGDIFFALDMQHAVQTSNRAYFEYIQTIGVKVYFLVHDLLPITLEEYFNNPHLKKLHEDLLSLIAITDGAICVSETTANEYRRWILENKIVTKNTMKIVSIPNGCDIDTIVSTKGIPENVDAILSKIKSNPTFLTVGTVEPRKAQKQVFDGFKRLWEENINVNLVIVGRAGWKTKDFINELKEYNKNEDRFFWFDDISDEFLSLIYKSSTCLIAASIDEGFGLPLIEASKYKLPIIARDIPIFREVAKEFAFYFVGLEDTDVSNAVKKWLNLYQNKSYPKSDNLPFSDWQESSKLLKEFLVGDTKKNKLFLDISELVQRDAKSGIQRVVRSILKELIENKLDDYIVEPIYSNNGDGYFYAREFIAKFIDEEISVQDTRIEYSEDDIFVGLDLNHAVVINNQNYYKEMENAGVSIYFVVYDLLPILAKKYFPEGVEDAHKRWVDVISSYSGVICISNTVADEFSKWIQEHNKENFLKCKVKWFHLGADISNSLPTTGLSEDYKEVIVKIKSKLSFLMVGTLEPRKGYDYVIEEFERIWEKGIDINLVIVGKNGWNVEKLVDKIKNHPEYYKRLIWLESISDEYLENVYKSSTALIAASYGEGFGLPLIEAAQKNIPIIARDIPVFREVAGEHAFYFDNVNKIGILEGKIQEWIELYKQNDHPKSDDMPWFSWQESTESLLKLLNII